MIEMTPKFYIDDSITDVPVSTASSVALPYGSVFMYPGVYTWLGVKYDCTEPGLYAFQQANGGFQKRIVAYDPTTQSMIDIYKFMSAVSWNHSHGWSQDGLSFQLLANSGQTQKWKASCGRIAGMCTWWLNIVGESARDVNVVTLDPYNGYNDGHIVCEWWDGSKYRMFDLTNGCYFKDGIGNHMSTQEIIDWLDTNPTGLPEKVRLDAAQKFGCEYRAGFFCGGTYWENMLATDVGLEKFYRRLFQSIV